MEGHVDGKPRSHGGERLISPAERFSPVGVRSAAGAAGSERAAALEAPAPPESWPGAKEPWTGGGAGLASSGRHQGPAADYLLILSASAGTEGSGHNY